MKIENERKCDDVIFDVDMSDEEFNAMLEYGKKNITDQELVNFAVRDIVIKQVKRMEVTGKADTVERIMENAAELGCPKDVEVDMWFRELTKMEQCDIVLHMEEIVDERYS